MRLERIEDRVAVEAKWVSLGDNADGKAKVEHGGGEVWVEEVAKALRVDWPLRNCATAKSYEISRVPCGRFARSSTPLCALSRNGVAIQRSRRR